METKRYYGAPDEEDHPSDSYEAALDKHTIPIVLPDGSKTPMTLNTKPGSTVQFVKSEIIRLHNFKDDATGDLVDHNLYELVIVTDLMDKDDGKVVPLKDELIFDSYDDELLHSMELHLAKRGTMPKKVPSGEGIATSVKYKN